MEWLLMADKELDNLLNDFYGTCEYVHEVVENIHNFSETPASLRESNQVLSPQEVKEKHFDEIVRIIEEEYPEEFEGVDLHKHVDTHLREVAYLLVDNVSDDYNVYLDPHTLDVLYPVEFLNYVDGGHLNGLVPFLIEGMKSSHALVGRAINLRNMSEITPEAFEKEFRQIDLSKPIDDIEKDLKSLAEDIEGDLESFENEYVEMLTRADDATRDLNKYNRDKWMIAQIVATR